MDWPRVLYISMWWFATSASQLLFARLQKTLRHHNTSSQAQSCLVCCSKKCQRLIDTMASTLSLKFLAVTLLASQASLCDGAVINARSDVPPGFVAAPYYPAPYGGWASDWSDSYKRAKEVVDRMTLAEKTNITSGTGIFMGRTILCRMMRFNPLMFFRVRPA